MSKRNDVSKDQEQIERIERLSNNFLKLKDTPQHMKDNSNDYIDDVISSINQATKLCNEQGRKLTITFS